MYPRNASDFRGVFMRNVLFALARTPGVRVVAFTPPGELPPRVVQAATAEESEWLGSLVEAGGISHAMRSGGVRALLAPVRMLKMLAQGFRRHPEVDAYHINWLQSAIPLPSDGKPALVTVLGNDLRLLRLPTVAWWIRRALRGRPAAICPNAQWMVEPLQRAFGDIAYVEAVSFGIDPHWFGIRREPPSDAPQRWLAVSRLTVEKLGPLFEWSAPMFADGQRELHLYGPMEQEVEIPSWVHYHGPAAPSQLAEEVFPHATGLLTLSRHAEGRPQVMLEAMAAGLPIIASRTEAHSSLVDDGVTGMLVEDEAGFAAALHALEDPERNHDAGAAARARVACDPGTWDDCIGRYRTIYARLGVAGDGND
ncbi:glycosyltransferase family 4 protein [Luteimonas changyuni]|uniref:glycosyltransferase family 4 protein n=1 Tax=Luteimonas sp. MJ145 TaxID=3129234 RepID=UPI0031BAA454